MKIRNKINRVLFVLSLGIGIFFSTGCSDDLMPDRGNVNLGEKVNGTISVPFGASSPVTVTRAVDFSQDAMVKIDSYWIGIFDTQTGELLGNAQDDEPRKENGTRNTLYNNSTPYTVNDIEIRYYENHPEIYIVGVINYKNVKAKANPKETSTVNLEELLPTINSFEEFTKISIDTQSADAANRSHGSDESCPLMMGFYRTGTSTTHATVTAEGSVTQDDTKVRITDGSSGKKLADGAIKLQRLLAEMNVTVFAEGYVTIKNVEYKIVNNPTNVYLTEHATDASGSVRSSLDDYLANTSNSADFNEGYVSDGTFKNASFNEGVYSFSYQAYENKHWGRTRSNYPKEKGPGDHASREQKYTATKDPEEGVFMSLCRDVVNPHNNKASFMVLKVDIEYSESDYSVPFTGTIYYTIHEGRTSNIDGSESNNPYDYQRLRNTQYFYEVHITGLNDLFVNVMTDRASHNDGVSGFVSKAKMTEVGGYGTNSSGQQVQLVSYEDFKELFENRKNLKWRYYVKTPEGIKNYGNWKNAESENYDWPTVTGPFETECPQEILNTFKFYVLDNQNGGQYVDGGWVGHIVKKWTVDEFINEEGDLPYYTGQTFTSYYVSIPKWEVDVHYSELKNYQRGFYFSYGGKDEDGCDASNFLGFLQVSPYDNRAYPPAPWGIYHKPGVDETWVEEFERGFRMALHTVDYLRWRCSSVWVNNVETEITEFIIQIDDDEPILAKASQYFKPTQYDPYVSAYWEMPVQTDAIGPGHHTVKITPVVDEDYVQPAETQVMDLDIIDSKWYFDGETWPVLVGQYFLNNNSIWEYNGLRLYCSTGGTAVTMGEGAVNMAGTGSFNNRSFVINIQKPGKIYVDVQYPNGSNVTRGVYFDNKLKNVFKEVPYGERVKLEFDTSEIFDDEAMITGGYEVALYCLQGLTIRGIEYVPD